MLKINGTTFQPADFQTGRWHALAEVGMTPESLLDPGAWANVAMHLQPFHVISVQANDASWWAEYLVWDCERLWARVELLRKAERGASVSAESKSAKAEDYRPVLRGIKKWSVIRESDKEVLKEGMQTRDEAVAYIGILMRDLAA